MFNKKSEYAQNKREKDSIIYISVNGTHPAHPAQTFPVRMNFSAGNNGPMRIIMRRNARGVATTTMGFLWTKT